MCTCRIGLWTQFTIFVGLLLFLLLSYFCEDIINRDSVACKLNLSNVTSKSRIVTFCPPFDISAFSTQCVAVCVQ